MCDSGKSNIIRGTKSLIFRYHFLHQPFTGKEFLVVRQNIQKEGMIYTGTLNVKTGKFKLGRS